jgi:Flp pilus assembly protein TadG
MKKIDRAAAKARHCAAHERGSVSIEVALIVPLMLLMLLGFGELYLYMRAVSLVEHTAFTIADSIGQMTQVVNDSGGSNADNLGALWSAAALIAQPEALSTAGGLIVTSVCDATTIPCGTTAPVADSMASGTPQIYWQAKAPWTASTMKSLVTAGSILPANWPFRNGDSAVVVEVFYSYRPFVMTSAFWSAAPGMTTIYRRVYVRPRSGQALPLVAAQ